MNKNKFIKKSIKRPGGLTENVGGKPSKNIDKVKYLSEHGTPLQKKQANFYLNVLRKSSKMR